MYTYVQRPGCKKENTTTYVYIRAGSRTPTRAYVRRGLVYMAGSERRNSVVVVFMGRNGMRGRVHREGFDRRGDGNEAWRTAQRRKRTSYGRNGGPVDREGCGIPQNGGNGPPTVETGVLLIGRGVAYRKTEEIGLCWTATVETGVLFIGRGVAYRKTGLHGILFISPVDLRQPPWATVDLVQPPWAPVHPASTAR